MSEPPPDRKDAEVPASAFVENLADLAWAYLDRLDLVATGRLLCVGDATRSLALDLAANGTLVTLVVSPSEVDSIEHEGVVVRTDIPPLSEAGTGDDDGEAPVFNAAYLADSFASRETFFRAVAAVRAVLVDGGRLLCGVTTAPVSRNATDDGTSIPTTKDALVALSENAFYVRSEDTTSENDEYVLLAAVKGDIFVRSYREDDERQILDLFHRLFQPDRGLDHWRWKYIDDPDGSLKITVAVTGEGALVGHYAGYPVRFVAADGEDHPEWPALQVGDTMTDPGVRGVGRGPTSVLARMVRHFYACYCHGEVAFNYGFNTANIQKFSLRYVGAERVGPVCYRECPVRSLRSSAGRSDFRQGDASVERVGEIERRWDDFFARVASDYGFLLVRDSSYLQWRYVDHPDVSYEIYAVSRGGRLLGWSVFRRDGETLVWGDALFDPRSPEAVQILLERVVERPEHADAVRITGWLSEDPTWWSELVEGLGFVRLQEPQELGVMMVPFDDKPAERFRRELYYTKGDSDLF